MGGSSLTAPCSTARTPEKMPRALAQGRSHTCTALPSQAQVICKQGLDVSTLKNADVNGRHLTGFHTWADFYSSAYEIPRWGRAAPSAPAPSAAPLSVPAPPLTRRSPAPAPPERPPTYPPQVPAEGEEEEEDRQVPHASLAPAGHAAPRRSAGPLGRRRAAAGSRRRTIGPAGRPAVPLPRGRPPPCGCRRLPHLPPPAARSGWQLAARLSPARSLAAFSSSSALRLAFLPLTLQPLSSAFLLLPLLAAPFQKECEPLPFDGTSPRRPSGAPWGSWQRSRSLPASCCQRSPSTCTEQPSWLFQAHGLPAAGTGKSTNPRTGVGCAKKRQGQGSLTASQDM